MAKIKIVAVATLLALLVSVSGVMAKKTFSAFGSDTIAGYSSYLKSTPVEPKTPFSFIVVQPDKSRLVLETETDTQGVARYELDGYHTQEAGMYYVFGRTVAGEKSDHSLFEVYSGDLSDNDSRVDVSAHTVRADGDATAFLLVELFDNYGNPLPGHVVNVVSSRAADTLESFSDSVLTDEEGMVGFVLSSEKAGVSTYTITDVTSGVTLSERPQVYFYDKRASGEIDDTELENIFFAVGGETDVDHFLIEDVPEVIKANESIGFTLIASDKDDNPIIDYVGTVHFSSSDENAELPVDYTFTEDDLGLHIFELSLRFSEAGTHTLTINDLENPDIESELEVVVLDSQHAAAAAGAALSIVTPQPGLTSDDTILLSGNGPEGALVKIFDGDTQAGVVQADDQGFFSFELKTLPDGEHILKVTSGEDESEPVTITIDTLPPGVDQITVEPSEVVSGGKLQVTVLTDSDAREVKIKLNGPITPLSGSEGSFSGEVVAPEEVGTYKFEVILKDNLGNQQSVPDAGSVTVIEPDTARFDLGNGATFEVPSQVSGVEAIGSDSQVTLRWAPATDNTGIDHYNVYYGTSPGALTQKQETFDNRTEWFVQPLTNGVTYYFEVRGVDTEGNEADQASAVVSAVAGGGSAPSASDFLDGGYIAPPLVTDTGPGTAGVFVMSGGLSWAWRKLRKKP